MRAETVVGVSLVVMGRRERAVVLEARGEGIVVWTLRFSDEVRPEKDCFIGMDSRPFAKAISAIENEIKKRTKDGHWIPLTDIAESCRVPFSQRTFALAFILALMCILTVATTLAYFLGVRPRGE